MSSTLRSPIPLAAVLVAGMAAGLSAGPLAPAAFARTADAGAEAQTFSGAYLASRAARLRNDIDAAARFSRQAADQRPGDVELARDALIFSLLNGDVSDAIRFAAVVRDLDGDESLTLMLSAVGAIADGDFETSAALLSQPQIEAETPEFLRRLLAGWIAAGGGDLDTARTILAGSAGPDGSGLGDDAGGGDLLAVYHLGLLESAEGRDVEAATILQAMREAAAASQPPVAFNRRIIVATGGALSRSGDLESAAALYALALEEDADAPRALAAVERLEAGAPEPLVVADARAGAAEAFHAFATALSGDRESAQRALIYGHMALFLRPDFEEARLLVGEIELTARQFEAAARSFARIPADSLFGEAAALGRASALRRGEDPEGALAAIDAYVAATPQPTAVVMLERASVLNALMRYEACAEAYESGLAALEAEEGEISPRRWFNVFGYGICLERTGRWPEAEAQLRRTLELRPDQPDVLNYLGYSLVEQRDKLDEALDMIRRAVDARPDSGHIVDSLGWALYRLGRYDEAVVELEKAAALEPTIAVINDHLGDALWRVGRRVEARFHWRRALSLAEEEGEDSDADIDRIRAKLERGFDVVLAEEAAVDGAGDDG